MKDIKKVPLFWILFGWNIMLLFFLFRTAAILLLWLIGYWFCHKCKRWFWVKDKHTFVFEGQRTGEIYTTCCASCKKEYEEERDRRRPPIRVSAVRPPAPSEPLPLRSIRG